MKMSHTLLGLIVLLANTQSLAKDIEMQTGDGRTFIHPFDGDLPGRAESADALWMMSRFTTNTDSTPMTITDQISIKLKGRNQPVRIVLEDVTGPSPILMYEDNSPYMRYSDAGARRTEWSINIKCEIARSRNCSRWMFLGLKHRIYRVEFTYANGNSAELYQVEPYDMTNFIARLGNRIPNPEAQAENNAEPEPEINE